MTYNFKYIPWSGTKRKHLGLLAPIFQGWVPDASSRFYDPFTGGGSVSWLMRQIFPQVSQVVGDRDPHLAALYRLQTQGAPDWNPEWLDVHLQRSYRDVDIANLSDADKAARLIVCLKTAFGSRYETSKDGRYRSTLRTDLKPENLRMFLQDIWQKAWLSTADKVIEGTWIDTIGDVKANDLVFLDPPYTETIGYGTNRWTVADQVDVWEWASQKITEGVAIVVTNHSDLERLYKKTGFDTSRFHAGRPSEEDRYEFIGHGGITPRGLFDFNH